MMQRIHDLKQLYEIDDSQWLGETVSLLRNHQFSQLDLEHLIEELEDLGKEKKNAVASNSIYQDALGFVKIKTVNTVIFPSQCPYSLEQLLDRSWLP